MEVVSNHGDHLVSPLGLGLVEAVPVPSLQGGTPPSEGVGLRDGDLLEEIP